MIARKKMHFSHKNLPKPMRFPRMMLLLAMPASAQNVLTVLSPDRIAENTASETLTTASASPKGTAPVTTTTASSAATATTTASAAALPLKGVGSTLRPCLQCPLVALDKTTRLVAECECQTLQSAELDTLPEDDGTVDLVEGSGKLFVTDHLADNSGDLALRQVEHGCKVVDGECVVVWCVGE